MRDRSEVMWWGIFAALLAVALTPLIPWQALAAAEAAPEPPPVLVIDPGHGGADGGAVAPDGLPESEVNLDIALRLEALAAFCGVETVMTRRESEIDYPADAGTLAQMKRADQNARLALVNGLPDAFLLSIHQNNYPAPPPRGIQVFYNGEDGSKAFADLLQDSLTAALYPENRRVAEKADEGIYLMRRCRHGAVLAECGFLSNPEDLKNLESEAYRTKLALVMAACWLRYIRGSPI